MVADVEGKLFFKLIQLRGSKHLLRNFYNSSFQFLTVTLSSYKIIFKTSIQGKFTNSSKWPNFQSSFKCRSTQSCFSYVQITNFFSQGIQKEPHRTCFWSECVICSFTNAIYGPAKPFSFFTVSLHLDCYAVSPWAMTSRTHIPNLWPDNVYEEETRGWQNFVVAFSTVMVHRNLSCDRIAFASAALVYQPAIHWQSNCKHVGPKSAATCSYQGGSSKNHVKIEHVFSANGAKRSFCGNSRFLCTRWEGGLGDQWKRSILTEKKGHEGNGETKTPNLRHKGK